MNIFVASWFFPPSTSSEGIVTYKLLRNSAHHYDVCSSKSDLWGYKKSLPLVASNIDVIPVDTDDLDTWVNEAVSCFEKRHAQKPYDAIMTRSMPPESIFVAKKIRETHPDIPWIASLADPIAKSPYDIKGLILNDDRLSDAEKADFQVALKYGCDAWRTHKNPNIRLLCEFKEIEDYAINNADALIFPHDTLAHYVLGTRRRKHVKSIPHTFDRSLACNEPRLRDDERVTLSFLGHTDASRTLEPLVRAMHRLSFMDSNALAKLRIRFIGHVTEEARSLVYNYDLYNYISLESDVSYLDSLSIMQESDWLIHIDAWFDTLADIGGSIFFAGKIADYFLTDAPVFAITGKHTPAYELVRYGGGVCFEQDDIDGIAAALRDIAHGNLIPPVDRAFRDLYDAQIVAKDYDQWVVSLVDNGEAKFSRTTWPTVPNLGSCTQKFLSICIPAYNVECYLDRCLFSLLSSACADQLELIVVDDGSPDNSAQIALAYQEKYPTIVKVIRKQNGGHGSTINAALEIASGVYFRVIDGDDWVDSANLAKLVNNIRAKNIWADLVSTNYRQVYSEDGFIVNWEKKSEVKDYELLDFATSDFTMEYFTMASTMVKTELLRAIGFKLQEHTYYVDVEYILFPIPFIETVMFTPEYVYRYAVGNADQSINRDVFTNRYDHHDRVIRRMLKYYHDHRERMSEGQRSYMESLFVRHLLNSHYTLSVIWDADKKRGYSRARDFDAFLKDIAPNLYDSYGKTHPAIIRLRATQFNARIPGRPTALDEHKVKQALEGAARQAAKTPLGKRMADNEELRAIARRFLR